MEKEASGWLFSSELLFLLTRGKRQGNPIKRLLPHTHSVTISGKHDLKAWQQAVPCSICNVAPLVLYSLGLCGTGLP